jgi:hypothetical protein
VIRVERVEAARRRLPVVAAAGLHEGGLLLPCTWISGEQGLLWWMAYAPAKKSWAETVNFLGGF